MENNELNYKIASTAMDVGFAVRQRVNEVSRTERARPSTSVLKPYQGDKAKYADAEGERVGFELLGKLSQEESLAIGIIVDPMAGDVLEIGDHSRGEISYCYFDAVDGTIKVAGLGSEPETGIHRVGNNGCWATGIAFTQPTGKGLSELVVGDFEISALVDGNPTVYRAYPTNAVCYPQADGELATFEKDEKTGAMYRLSTSSQTNLGQATLLFDAFQAFDRNSAPERAEALAVEIYRRVIDRNEEGAFDIVRMYANMGETLRQLLERKDGGIESQGAGAITINENLPNLVPITPIVEGAGGYVVEAHQGMPIREMSLTYGRPDVVIAANREILEKLEGIVQDSGSELS